MYGVLKGSDSATQNAWLGGTDAATEKTWTWEDGTSFGYTNWHTNFENVADQDCMQMRHAEGVVSSEDLFNHSSLLDTGETKI